MRDAQPAEQLQSANSQLKRAMLSMIDVDRRLAELESARVDPGLSVAEQNELRDCEITLGMVWAPPIARAEAARRVERFAAERIAKKTSA